jgi:addiction module HigA family antidote
MKLSFVRFKLPQWTPGDSLAGRQDICRAVTSKGSRTRFGLFLVCPAFRGNERRILRSTFHPGHFLRKLVNGHGISQTRLARHLGVQIGVINQICNEKRGISPAMAIKLSMALGTSPEF